MMTSLKALIFLLIPVCLQFANATTLDGLWLRACQQGLIQIQEFQGENNLADEIYFEDANCTSPMMSFLNTGTSQIEKQNINFKFKDVSIALYTDKLVTDFNKRSVCGKKDWKKNSPTVVTGLRCALFQENKLVQVPSAGEMRFGIWKFENSRLYFGKLTEQENGTTPEKRPTNWDPRPYFKQQL